MLKRLSIVHIVILSAAGLASAQTSLKLNPTTESRFPASLAGARVPTWGGGALVHIAGMSESPTPIFSVYERNGLTTSVWLSIPEADRVSIYDYSRGANGAVALCGLIYAGDAGYTPYVAWVSADGSDKRIIRLAPYYAYRVAAAPDGTVWTLGYEMIGGSETAKGVDREAGVIRHFDKNGSELGRFVPRSSITDKVDISNGRLSASNDRVGWFPYASGKGEYIEVLSSGEVQRFPVVTSEGHIKPSLLNGFVLSAVMNHAALSLQGRGGVQLYVLDREKRHWTRITPPMSLANAKYFQLLGSEGDELAFLIPSANGEAQPVVQFVRVSK